MRVGIVDRAEGLSGRLGLVDPEAETGVPVSYSGALTVLARAGRRPARSYRCRGTRRPATHGGSWLLPWLHMSLLGACSRFGCLR